LRTHAAVIAGSNLINDPSEQDGRFPAFAHAYIDFGDTESSSARSAVVSIFLNPSIFRLIEQLDEIVSLKSRDVRLIFEIK
jgi:hypothetical protein